MIILQSDVGRELSALELDENFRTLDSPPVEIIDTGENTYTPDMDAPGNVFKYTITEATTIDPPLKVKVGTYGFLMIWQDDRGGHEYEFSKAAYWVVGSKEVPSRRPSSLSIFRYNVVEDDVIIIELLYTDPKVMFWDDVEPGEDILFQGSAIREANTMDPSTVIDEHVVFYEANIRTFTSGMATTDVDGHNIGVLDGHMRLYIDNIRPL